MKATMGSQAAPYGTRRRQLRALTEGVVLVVPTAGQRDSLRTLARRMKMPLSTHRNSQGYVIWRADVCNEFMNGAGI